MRISDWSSDVCSSDLVNFDAVSFGLNFEVPVFVNPDSRLPDIRIGGGGTVFYAENAARTYGFHAGIRFDFKILAACLFTKGGLRAAFSLSGNSPRPAPEAARTRKSIRMNSSH